MKRFIIILFTILSVLTIQAQNVIFIGGGSPNKEKNDSTAKRHIRLTGSVYDSFTKAALKAHMTLMRSRYHDKFCVVVGNQQLVLRVQGAAPS